jgi:hypothetical protein
VVAGLGSGTRSDDKASCWYWGCGEKGFAQWSDTKLWDKMCYGPRGLGLSSATVKLDGATLGLEL